VRVPKRILLSFTWASPNIFEESPRFLIKRGRKHYPEAYKSLLYLRGSPLLAAKELFYVHSQIEVEKRLLSQRNPDVEKQLSSQGHGQSDPESTQVLNSKTERYSDDIVGAHVVKRTVSGIDKDVEGVSQIEGSQGKGSLSYANPQGDSPKSTNYVKNFRHRLNSPSDRSINYWQKLGQLITKQRIRRVRSCLPNIRPFHFC
jgi:hypothetical protein